MDSSHEQDLDDPACHGQRKENRTEGCPPYRAQGLPATKQRRRPLGQQENHVAEQQMASGVECERVAKSTVRKCDHRAGQPAAGTIGVENEPTQARVETYGARRQ